MRVAIFSTCPKGVYSGGRYHALIAGYCLARRGHEVYFITDNAPVFDADLKAISPDNPVKIVQTKDFEIVSQHRFDHVIIAPQNSRYRRLYMNAIRLAEMNQAALSIFCFEAANWFNEVSPKKRAFSDWMEWHLPASRGALILCSADESLRYAKEYFTDIHPETDFGVWQPAINQVARDNARSEPREGNVLIFARPMDPHKGSGVVEQLLVPELKDHNIVVVIGNPRGAEPYCDRIKQLARVHGNQVTFRFGLSDVEKFVELKRASALLFPSFFEGYGYPPIEALATDTHCIAYDLPVVRENCGDLVRYVEPGNVEALRAELIKALATGEPSTSRDEGVVFRTDIDIRAQKLEEVLETYRKQRDKGRLVSLAAAQKLRCDLSTLERIRLGDRLVHSVVVAAPRRIFAAAFSGPFAASCSIAQTISVGGKILHQLLIETRLPEGKDAPAWTGGSVYLSFGGDGGAVLPLPDEIRDIGKGGKFDSRTVGVTQIYEGAGRTSIFGWALPEKAYDTAVWVSIGETEVSCVLADIGFVTGAYPKKSGVTEKIDCGFNISFASTADLHGENHLLLLHEGRIVFSAEISAKEMASAERRLPTEISRPIATKGEGPKLFRTKSLRSPDRTFVRGWSNAVDYPTSLDVRHMPAGAKSAAESRLVTRLRPNMLRPDAATEHGFARDDIGFGCALPTLKSGEYMLVLQGPGAEIDRMNHIKLVEDEGRLPRLKPGPLALSTSLDQHCGSDMVVARPCKRAISKFAYDAATGKISLTGWMLATKSITLALVDAASQEEIYSFSDLKPRPDVADKHGQKFLNSGIDVDVEVSGVSPSGYLLRIQHGDASAEIHKLPAPQLQGVTEFKVADCRYDLQWPSVWVRGTFVCPNTRLTGIEMWQHGKFLCKGAVNVKQMRHGDPLAGWRIEGVLDAPMDPAQPIEIRASTDCGAVSTIRFTPTAIPLPATARPLDGAMARLGASGAFREHVLPEGVRADRTVLLVVHNLDAIDRPEKLNALIGLRAALAQEGLDLVIFHHCRNPIPAALPEINFFDPYFELSHQIQGAALAREVREHIPQERMSAIVGGLYGFYASLNFSPRSWKDCIEQIEDEAQRLYTVLKEVQPRYVLLWHQWNSVMEIGRSLCDSMGLPRAYLHEGMLPKTMTFDPQGMMAEAQSAGALLSAPGVAPLPEDQMWLDRADAVIARIRDEALDRKPASAIRVGDFGRKLADGMGAKLVFYAGINDWHSGNLPEAGGKIHSPYYRDTMDGLQALLDIAEANNWLIMFKPHPNLYPTVIASHPRLFTVREGNTIDCIDVADVVVTILSSVSYISMARGKPTVLIGRNTLAGTGSVHEVTDRADLARVVADALSGAGAGDRQRAFHNHVAALLRDHLYCYDPEDTLAILDHALLARRLWAKLGTGPEAEPAEGIPEGAPKRSRKLKELA